MSDPWSGDWVRRIQDRLAEFSCGTLAEFLEHLPGEPYREVAARLADDGDIVATQLEALQFQEAEARHRLRTAARDALARVVNTLFPAGWVNGPAGEASRASAYVKWTSLFQHSSLAGDLAPLLNTVWLNLLEHAPPDGWRPEGPDDPRLISACENGWPSSLGD